MDFRRGEGFRFDFQKPLSTTFSLLINGKTENSERKQYEYRIIDISPRGMKMFSFADFGDHTNKLLQLDQSATEL